MKLAKLAVVFLALAFAVSAQTSSTTGKWKITWLQGGTPNILTLIDKDGAVSGSYTSNTLGEACPVSGTNNDRKISLHIVCTKWDITLNGQLSDDAVDGSYAAYGNSTGTFKMKKQAK
jgi:hypothetical protein